MCRRSPGEAGSSIVGYWIETPEKAEQVVISLLPHRPNTPIPTQIATHETLRPQTSDLRPHPNLSRAIPLNISIVLSSFRLTSATRSSLSAARARNTSSFLNSLSPFFLSSFCTSAL